MNSLQLEHILSRALRRTGTTFLGVFPADLIPDSSTNYPCCYVANTDPHTQDGTHWVAFYLDSPDHLDFFDSYGMPPSAYQFPVVASHVQSNSRDFQSHTSDVCGHYCVYFLYHRCRRQSLRSITQNLVKCGNCTDHCVNRFLTDLIDSNYLHIPSLCSSQSCIRRKK